MVTALVVGWPKTSLTVAEVLRGQWRHTCGVTVNSPGEEDVHVKPYDADSHPWEVFPLKWSHAQAGCAQRIRIGFQGS